MNIKKKDITKEVLNVKTKVVDYVKANQIEDWIIGFPLETDFGYVRPIKVKERSRLSNEMNFLKLEGWQVTKEIIKAISNDINKEDIERQLTDNSFITCVKNNVKNLRTTYKHIFDNFFVDKFDEKLFSTMSQTDFDELRFLILDFNSISYRKINPNEEIDRFDRNKYLIAQAKGQMISFDTMYTTLMTKEGGGHLPWNLPEFTIRQFVHAFKRVEFVKGSEITTLYKTVDSENKVEVVNWFKSTMKEEKEEKSYKSKEDLKKSNAFNSSK